MRVFFFESLQNFQQEEIASTNYNLLDEVFEDTFGIKTLFENILNDVTEDFLTYINEDETEVDENQTDVFPTNDDLADLLGDAFETDNPNFQDSIENFDADLFDNLVEEVDEGIDIEEEAIEPEEVLAEEKIIPVEENVSSKQIVIEGMDEFLQVSSVISFQVPTKVQDDIPMTVIDHQNYTQLECLSQSVSLKIFK